MAANGVRFIRVHGRVVPMHAHKGESVSSAAKTGAKVGLALGATAYAGKVASRVGQFKMVASSLGLSNVMIRPSLKGVSSALGKHMAIGAGIGVLSGAAIQGFKNSRKKK
jgi:hypothetical protein